MSSSEIAGRRSASGEVAAADCAIRLRRGRPCLIAEPDRRRMLIDAAECVFLDLGYSAASTSDIARKAGMSKKTIYRLFESKEDLFAAVIAARRETLTLIPLEEPRTAGDVETILTAYLAAMARFILAPRQAALFRLVIAEAHRAPELSRAFYSEGPAKARAPLIEWIERQMRRDVLCVADSSASASMLLSMVIADLHMRLLIGDVMQADEPEIAARVELAVTVFLRGCMGPANKMAGQERG